MRKLIAGNWKMNPDPAGAAALAQAVCGAVRDQAVPGAELLICPPFVYLERVAGVLKGSPVALGAQDCSEHDSGAHTGDVSAPMLKAIGCTHVILGHSERRQGHGETDAQVAAKAAAAHRHGLIAIICVGETESERAAGKENDVVAAQIKDSLPPSATPANTVIAYEPVWAIGTGKTATPDDAAAMHKFIHGRLPPGPWRILYGGSMKPDNAGALLARPHIDGGLIGGASLKAHDFIAIAKAAETL